MATITQYLIKNGAVQSGYTFTASTTSAGPVEGVNLAFTRRGFDSNSVSSDYRRLRENVTSYANREGTYYLSANISFSGWSKLRCTMYSNYNATDGTGRYLRLYIYKNGSTYLDSGTKGTNYQYVQATTSSATRDITLSSTLISNCNRIAFAVATSYADVSGYIKDLWLERDAETYTVSYNANGHGTAPSSQTKTEGTALTLRSFIGDVTTGGTTSNYTITGNASANGGTWSGSNGSASYTTLKHVYSQTYWNTNSSGTGTNYSSGGSYTANAGTTLYAIWKDTQTAASYTYVLPTGTPTKAASTTDNFTVTFNANGGTTTKTSQSSSKPVTYSFSGWFTAASGGTQRTTSSHVTASETVYAQFSSTTGSQTVVTLPTAAQCTRDGYELLGFSTSDTATTATYAPGASYTPSASIVLYAVWLITTSVFPKVYVNGAWRDATPHVYVNGAWKEAKADIRIGGAWKE